MQTGPDTNNLSEIRVRRSGLITFAIRLGSTLTGLAFVVLVTSHLSQADFGLWQLISRVIGYAIFVVNILNFWTIRYRARGTIIGKTVMLGCAVFSVIVSAVYVLVSYGVAGSVSGSSLRFFLLAAPQVPLYIFSGVLESILWGSVPEKASFGFGIYEVSKVALGGVLVVVFHLSLTGAILAIMGAQIVQIIATLVMTPKEYSDKISLSTLSKMVKTGWLALLNQLTPLVTNLDFLIVAVLTASTLPLAYYGVAFTYGTIITYSGWIAYGLYAGILAGVDPKKSTNEVLELQYLFIIPMVLGEVVLSYRLLHLFKAAYTAAIPILLILTIASAFNALSQTFDNVITAIDTTDATNATDFSTYLKSKLFLIAKINITLSVLYLSSVAAVSFFLRSSSFTIFGYSGTILIGILWSVSALGMWGVAVALKLRYVRQITKLSVPARTASALLLGAIGYSFILYLSNRLIPVSGDEIYQALMILVIGIISISVYAGIILTVSERFRILTRYALKSLSK